MDERVRKVALRFLEVSGGKILEEDFDGHIIIEDEYGLAVVDVFLIDEMSDKSPKMKRDVFEDVIEKYYASKDEPMDVAIRYDMIELCVIRDDKAIARYHTGVRLED